METFKQQKKDLMESIDNSRELLEEFIFMKNIDNVNKLKKAIKKKILLCRNMEYIYIRKNIRFKSYYSIKRTLQTK